MNIQEFIAQLACEHGFHKPQPANEGDNYLIMRGCSLVFSDGSSVPIPDRQTCDCVCERCGAFMPAYGPR